MKTGKRLSIFLIIPWFLPIPLFIKSGFQAINDKINQGFPTRLVEVSRQTGFFYYGKDSQFLFYSYSGLIELCRFGNCKFS